MDAQVSMRSSFPFLDLPLEIRSMVYKACLIPSEDIIIQVDQKIQRRRRCRAWEDRYVNEENVRLEGSWGPQSQVFNANILSTSRAVYREAANILYSSNTFRFLDDEGWKDFSHFEKRLTEVSRNSIRRLAFSLPLIYRCNDVIDYSEHLGPMWGLLPRLDALPALEQLDLQLSNDIEFMELEALQKIEDCRRKAKAELKVVVSPLGTWAHRFITTKHGAGLVATMMEWGWQLEGDVLTTGYRGS